MTSPKLQSMTVIPVGFAQVTWEFTGASVPTGAACTLGLNISGYAGSPTAAALECVTIWEAEIQPFLTNTTVLALARVKFGPVQTGPSGESASGQAGGGAGTGSSPAISWLVHKQTAFGGRAGRGRMFVPGLLESSVDTGGAIDGGSVAAMQGGMDALLADLGTALLVPVLLHDVGSPISAPSTILDLTVDSMVATQRRRQRR